MIPQIDRFDDPEHAAFTFEGGQPAALLVHGFPGSPAEMRPLGRALHAAGWTVHAPLLPGFGREMASLIEKSHEEWAAAIHAALSALRERHSPVILVGHSMGAALSLRVAAEASPDALIVTAPFYRLGPWSLQGIWPLLALLGTTVRPFRLFRLDLDQPEVREGMSNWLGDMDLDDPTVRREVQELAIPIRPFNELRRAGDAAYRAAPSLRVPTLIIQGLQDQMVTTDRTRALLPRIPGVLHYVEVPCDHDLVNDTQPAWPQIEKAVLDFAGLVVNGRMPHA